jgi:hypothetical protein
MLAVLIENEGEMLPDELRARDTAFTGGAREQPIVSPIKRDGCRFLSRKCHKSNMTY